MDSYLSGRERVGDTPKGKEPMKLGPQAMGQLMPSDQPDAQLSEECGEGGSRVSYVTEEGRVTKIVVTCACGQVTEIDCKYEE